MSDCPNCGAPASVGPDGRLDCFSCLWVEPHTPPTKERLALALEAAGAPAGMVKDARAGVFDDFESESLTPTFDLVQMARMYHLHDIAQRAIEGEFDCTPEESKAWADSVTDPEMRHVLDTLSDPTVEE